MTGRVILTASSEFETAALAEIKAAGVQAFGIHPRSARRGTKKGGTKGHSIPDTLPVSSCSSWQSKGAEGSVPSSRRLAPGILLLDLPGGFGEISSTLSEHPPLFIRHIQPVEREVALEGAAADLERLEAAALELASRLDPGQPFSVQTRLTASLLHGAAAKSAPYGRFEVNERLAAALHEATGAPLDVRAPAQVLSVLVTPEVAYVGLSWTDENMSAWAGGAMRFAREPEQVSRAEFKLMEALRVFALSLPVAGSALDLGASPGGWTRLLRKAGLEVTAVDPGDLDPRVAGDPGVRHLRLTAQEFRCREGEYAVVVNDMRMDARDSARLMLGFAPCQAADGWAMMTLKLPHRAPEVAAHRAIELLKRRYQVLGARQLYHNRSEITVALQPLAKGTE